MKYEKKYVFPILIYSQIKTDKGNYEENTEILNFWTKKNGAKFILGAAFFEELRINIIRRS